MKSALWLIWTVIALVLTAGIVRWHVEYFRSPGPQFYRATLIGLPLLAIGVLAWSRLRTKFLWRYELVAIIAVPATAALIREPRATLVIAALFSACYCAGRTLCERCGWDTDAPAADLVYSTACGFAILNTTLFITGLLRLWYPWLFGISLVAPAVLFWRNLLRQIRSVRAIFLRWGTLDDLRNPVAGILIPFAAILAACTTVVMLAPTLSYDAMKMHLPLAQHYLQVHRLDPIPGLDYSFFPQAAESLFALAWALGGQAAAQFVGPMFFVLTLLVAWVLARDCGAKPDGALAGVVLVASVPVLHWAESVPKNDAEVTFFVIVALAAALRWRATSEFKWAQAGLLFLACAFATKDLALLGAIPLGIVFLYAAWRQPRRLRAFASLALIFGVVALIWNVRRFVLTGNPIYPLALGSSMIPGWPPDPSFGGTIVRLLRLPWDLHVHGTAFSETVLIAPLGIVFVMFWPMWLFTRRPARGESLCLGFAIMSFLAWGWLTPYARYALAPLIVFALFTGVRLARYWQESTRLIRASLAAACVWVLIPAVCASMIVEINAPQLRYVAGAISRDQYLGEALLTYPPLAWLRDHAKPGDRILALENCSDVYAPAFAVYQSNCGFRPWTAPGILRQLNAQKSDWLLARESDREAVRAALGLKSRTASEEYSDSKFMIYRIF